VLDFRAKHGVTAATVESIDVDVVQHTYNRIAFRVPQTGIQGKFCMGYILARAIIDGRVSLDAFTDAAVKDPDILKLAEKVQMRLDNNLKAENEGGRPCRVTIRLKNGQTLRREAQHAKGSPEVPMTPDEIKAKFTECARQTISDGSAHRALDCVERLETLESVRPLCQLLMGEK
jgi:2-methylcitrate dehydratase PrpD